MDTVQVLDGRIVTVWRNTRRADVIAPSDALLFEVASEVAVAGMAWPVEPQ